MAKEGVCMVLTLALSICVRDGQLGILVGLLIAGAAFVFDSVDSWEISPFLKRE